VLTRSSRIHKALAVARRTSTHPPASWVAEPPTELHHVKAETALAPGISFADARTALLGWDIHRRSGLRVEADGPAQVGGTVVVALRLWPLWVAAPCRVVDIIDEPLQAGFTYATLPKHPELGVERFIIEDTAEGLRFSVEAVSRPAAWYSKLAPPMARRVQGHVIDRYLWAAREIRAAGGSPSEGRRDMQTPHPRS
jgi:uncharacterized protein (UPF0548 family)